MRCKCKILAVDGTPASDSSVIPEPVMSNYINSPECREMLDMHKMIGSLTHRSRNIQSAIPNNQNLSKVVGKDDGLIIVQEGAPTPTHYLEDLYIEDGWLWGTVKILEEDGLDDLAIQNIRRLKGMLSQGILPGVSAVIVGYWNSTNYGDRLERIKSLKGIDITLNPSWAKAGIMEVYDDKDERKFSEISEEDNNYNNTIRVKTFSDTSSFDLKDTPKSSKINGYFTKLKVKEFSCNSVSTVIIDEEAQEKEFSAAMVNERVRFATKLSPRERFRRLVLDYRQALKSQGGVDNIKPEALEAMKSLFASDVLNLMQVITPMVLQGKNLTTLLNAGSLGVEVRKACQAMMIPYRQAMMEVKKQGFCSKMRYQRISNSYTDFINALQNAVFGSKKMEIDDQLEEGEE